MRLRYAGAVKRRSKSMFLVMFCSYRQSPQLRHAQSWLKKCQPVCCRVYLLHCARRLGQDASRIGMVGFGLRKETQAPFCTETDNTYPSDGGTWPIPNEKAIK